MKICHHQNIEEIVESKMISKSDAVCFIYEIAKGMKYTHSLKIVHRNLKPSNIFINSDFTINKLYILLKLLLFTQLD